MRERRPFACSAPELFSPALFVKRADQSSRHTRAKEQGAESVREWQSAGKAPATSSALPVKIFMRRLWNACEPRRCAAGGYAWRLPLVDSEGGDRRCDRDTAGL